MLHLISIGQAKKKRKFRTSVRYSYWQAVEGLGLLFWNPVQYLDWKTQPLKKIVFLMSGQVTGLNTVLYVINRKALFKFWFCYTYDLQTFYRFCLKKSKKVNISRKLENMQTL